jgi:thioesterase domain-containing protein/acyl carrier protein
MVPSDFVVLERLPLTPNGKVNRLALPRPDTNPEPAESAPPRDELETLLLNIWKKVLGTSAVGITDNFFELGGHSLLAVRLVSEIEKATGKEIQLSTLFRGATVEYLARVVREEGSPRHQLILGIQEGGSQPPFFGIVTPGMNALGYIALARHLGPDQPLYRIQGPGTRLKGRSYSKAEFENLAAEYIEAMKTIQPQGPYYLGGMCEGARIAFDMARLLETRGEEVGLLAIFDTWVLENSQNRFLWKIDYYSGRLKRFRAYSAAEKRRFVGQWFKKRVKQSPQAPQPEGSDWPTTYWPGKDFVPEKFGGRITVFKIPKQPFFYVRDPLMGWGSRTAADVDLHLVKSKHGFFMREPYVRDLAQKLALCLQQSREMAERKNQPSDAQAASKHLIFSGERVSL